MRKTIVTFVVLIFLAISFNFLHQYVLNLKKLQITELSGNLTQKQINRITSNSEHLDYLNCFVVPVNILIKINLVALILFIGAFVFGLKVKYKELLNIVIRAEFLFLLPVLYEIIHFKFIQTNHSYIDIQYFSSLSVLNIISYKDLESWFIYPFQILNLFEVAYWLILAYYIGKSTKTNINNGLKVVACTYGSALLLWVVTIMFFTLNYS